MKSQYTKSKNYSSDLPHSRRIIVSNILRKYISGLKAILGAGRNRGSIIRPFETRIPSDPRSRSERIFREARTRKLYPFNSFAILTSTGYPIATSTGSGSNPARSTCRRKNSKNAGLAWESSEAYIFRRKTDKTEETFDREFN